MSKIMFACSCLAVLSACSPSQVSSGVSTTNAGISVANTVVADGQLVCAEGPTVVAMIAAGTNQPILAKGASSTFVKTVCGLINAIPVVPPIGPVPRVAVVPPTV